VTARPRQCLSRCSSAACWYGPHLSRSEPALAHERGSGGSGTSG
jgi:hypothetical protein